MGRQRLHERGLAHQLGVLPSNLLIEILDSSEHKLRAIGGPPQDVFLPSLLKE